MEIWYLTFTMNILMQNIEVLIFDIYNKDKFSILHGAENLGIHQILDFEQCKLSFIQNISLFLFGWNPTHKLLSTKFGRILRYVNCPCKKKPGDPRKPLGFRLSWLFHAIFGSEKPGKARKFLAFSENLELYSKKSLESQEVTLGESLEFDHNRKSKKSQESQELPKISWLSRKGLSN